MEPEAEVRKKVAEVPGQKKAPAEPLLKADPLPKDVVKSPSVRESHATPDVVTDERKKVAPPVTIKLSHVLRFCFPEVETQRKNDKQEFQKRRKQEGCDQEKRFENFYEPLIPNDSPIGRLDCIALFGPLDPTDGQLYTSVCIPGTGAHSIREKLREKESEAVRKNERVEQIRSNLKMAVDRLTKLWKVEEEADEASGNGRAVITSPPSTVSKSSLKPQKFPSSAAEKNRFDDNLADEKPLSNNSPRNRYFQVITSPKTRRKKLNSLLGMIFAREDLPPDDVLRTNDQVEKGLQPEDFPEDFYRDLELIDRAAALAENDPDRHVQELRLQLLKSFRSNGGVNRYARRRTRRQDDSDSSASTSVSPRSPNGQQGALLSPREHHGDSSRSVERRHRGATQDIISGPDASPADRRFHVAHQNSMEGKIIARVKAMDENTTSTLVSAKKSGVGKQGGASSSKSTLKQPSLISAQEYEDEVRKQKARRRLLKELDMDFDKISHGSRKVQYSAAFCMKQGILNESDFDKGLAGAEKKFLTRIQKSAIASQNETTHKLCVQKRKLTQREIYNMYREYHREQWRRRLPERKSLDGVMNLTLGLVDDHSEKVRRIQEKDSGSNYIANLGQAPYIVHSKKSNVGLSKNVNLNTDGWRSTWKRGGMPGAIIENEANLYGGRNPVALANHGLDVGWRPGELMPTEDNKPQTKTLQHSEILRYKRANVLSKKAGEIDNIHSYKVNMGQVTLNRAGSQTVNYQTMNRRSQPAPQGIVLANDRDMRDMVATGCLYSKQDIIDMMETCICKEKELTDVDEWDKSGPYPGGRDIFVNFTELQEMVMQNMKTRFAKALHMVKKVADPTQVRDTKAIVKWVKMHSEPPKPARQSILEQIDERVEDDGSYMVCPLPGKKPKTRKPKAKSRSPSPRGKATHDVIVKLPNLRGNTGTGTTNWWAL